MDNINVAKWKKNLNILLHHLVVRVVKCNKDEVLNEEGVNFHHHLYDTWG